MPEATVYWKDGSITKVTLQIYGFKVATEYGELDIPFAKARRIDFGWHYPEGVEKKITESIRQLNSNTFRERDQATKFLLEVGPLAYPLLKQASQNQDDPESSQRVAVIMKQLKERNLPENLSGGEEDLIATSKFPVVGRVVGTEFPSKFRSKDHPLVFAEIRSIRAGAEGGQKNFTIDAAKNGSGPEQWLDSEVNISSDSRLIITAEGQVDLWPSGPGQYMTTPKGYTTAGKGSTYMAGALVGRIGEAGKMFLIGERYDGRPAEEGRLHLLIVPSPWNNSSTGSYRVKVMAGTIIGQQ